MCDFYFKDAAETQAVAAAFADTEDAMRVDGNSSAGSSDEVSSQLECAPPPEHNDLISFITISFYVAQKINYIKRCMYFSVYCGIFFKY